MTATDPLYAAYLADLERHGETIETADCFFADWCLSREWEAASRAARAAECRCGDLCDSGLPCPMRDN